MVTSLFFFLQKASRFGARSMKEDFGIPGPIPVFEGNCHFNDGGFRGNGFPRSLKKSLFLTIDELLKRLLRPK